MLVGYMIFCNEHHLWVVICQWQWITTTHGKQYERKISKKTRHWNEKRLFSVSDFIVVDYCSRCKY